MKIVPSPRGAIRCAAAVLLTAVAGCATPPSDPTERAAFEQTNDPLEPLNRQTLEVNLFVDRILLKPVAQVYSAIVPEVGREAVHRALDNMKEPVVVINNLLQGELERAEISVGRFGVNTTIGLGGLLDVANKWGLEKQSGDFGQTLFAWGLPQGPYLIAPLLGPSNPRDLIGMGADAYFDPFDYLATVKDLDEIQIARFILDGVDQRARNLDILDDLQKNSLDFYAELRSLSEQHRAAELRHGAAPQPAPNFYQDPNAPPAAPPASPRSPQSSGPAASGGEASAPPPPSPSP
ncbi:MAG TPA: VacJ family lipoprotein [Stellaceae bacterium]|nr:VacJ family lipoprotein [Stellaceae bacterium]